MTLRAPFSPQHLLGIRLRFTQVCTARQTRLVTDFFYRRVFVSQDLANKVLRSSCPHKTSSRILPSAQKLFFSIFHAQHQSGVLTVYLIFFFFPNLSVLSSPQVTAAATTAQSMLMCNR